jgi:hypothetical protein
VEDNQDILFDPPVISPFEVAFTHIIDRRTGGKQGMVTMAPT